jgi:hypothetical protein
MAASQQGADMATPFTGHFTVKAPTWRAPHDDVFPGFVHERSQIGDQLAVSRGFLDAL